MPSTGYVIRHLCYLLGFGRRAPRVAVALHAVAATSSRRCWRTGDVPVCASGGAFGALLLVAGRARLAMGTVAPRDAARRAPGAIGRLPEPPEASRF